MEAHNEKNTPHKYPAVSGLTVDNRRNTWEENRTTIVDCIQNLLNANIKPTITKVGEETGLSRPTIYKHLEEFEQHPFSHDDKLIMLMQAKVLQKVCEQALNGDLKAAKLYFEKTSPRAGKNINNNYINQRSNTINFNGLLISEEILQSLPTEKRDLIENIIKTGGNNKPKKMK